ncbi:hypothetical protein J6590_000619 [Homalodisca vitripennis]|nr:hypothetical protein J6590_000619 [Homalodisca vitripennis]
MRLDHVSMMNVSYRNIELETVPISLYSLPWPLLKKGTFITFQTKKHHKPEWLQPLVLTTHTCLQRVQRTPVVPVVVEGSLHLLGDLEEPEDMVVLELKEALVDTVGQAVLVDTVVPEQLEAAADMEELEVPEQADMVELQVPELADMVVPEVQAAQEPVVMEELQEEQEEEVDTVEQEVQEPVVMVELELVVPEPTEVLVEPADVEDMVELVEPEQVDTEALELVELEDTEVLELVELEDTEVLELVEPGDTEVLELEVPEDLRVLELEEQEDMVEPDLELEAMAALVEPEDVEVMVEPEVLELVVMEVVPEPELEVMEVPEVLVVMEALVVLLDPSFPSSHTKTIPILEMALTLGAMNLVMESRLKRKDI